MAGVPTVIWQHRSSSIVGIRRSPEVTSRKRLRPSTTFIGSVGVAAAIPRGKRTTEGMDVDQAKEDESGPLEVQVSMYCGGNYYVRRICFVFVLQMQ